MSVKQYRLWMSLILTDIPLNDAKGIIGVIPNNIWQQQQQQQRGRVFQLFLVDFG